MSFKCKNMKNIDWIHIMKTKIFPQNSGQGFKNFEAIDP